jgi:hypothetical protein
MKSVPAIPPRIIRPGELPQYLRRSKTWFCRNKEQLAGTGFPEQVPVIGGYDVRELDAWVDALKKTANESPKAANEDWSGAADIRI